MVLVLWLVIFRIVFQRVSILSWVEINLVSNTKPVSTSNTPTQGTIHRRLSQILLPSSSFILPPRTPQNPPRKLSGPPSFRRRLSPARPAALPSSPPFNFSAPEGAFPSLSRETPRVSGGSGGERVEVHGRMVGSALSEVSEDGFFWYTVEPFRKAQ